MSRVVFQVLRSDEKKRQSFQTYEYEAEDPGMTVATALRRLNAGLSDPIAWECSCLQKKCGACAMRINGRPRLACEAVLGEFGKRAPRRAAGAPIEITLEPLRKFPLVRDLIVDRSILRENLKEMQVWIPEREGAAGEKSFAGDDALGYEGSRCLQCGCCLEICPNFYTEGAFAGTAAMVPASRLLARLPQKETEELRRAYRRHIYEGCGKSLSCRDVCPAGIDVERLLVRSNAAAVWRKHR